MKNLITTLMIVLALPWVVSAQTADYSIFNYQHFIPRVTLDDQETVLQESLFPKLYDTRSAASDIRWLARNDSALTNFWTTRGDSTLHIMRELSGIEWTEREFPVYLVRFYPSLGSANPLVLPIGSFGDGTVMEAAPEGSRQVLILLYLLAHRMLDQAKNPARGVYLSLADHPLMRPGPYRRDCLAWLLALSTCESILGMDSTYNAYNSAFIKNHQKGRRIFEKLYRSQWVLTPDRTLADWINAEPFSSALVAQTRPPRKQKDRTGNTSRVYIEGLPLKGELGFAVQQDDSKRFKINKIDIYRLAYACGLRQGDIIYRVSGQRPRTQKALIEKILQGLAAGGCELDIIRDGQSRLVLVQPFQDATFYEDMTDPYGPEIPVNSEDNPQ